MSEQLELGWYELLMAAQVGAARNVSAIFDDRPLEDGRRDAGFERHIDGAIAEYAVARYLDCCWTPAVGRLDTADGDLPGGVHVKSTRRQDGCLIVREHDPDELDYVLVLLQPRSAIIAGWLTGADAKLPQFWREQQAGVHRAAYFVPKSALMPMEELRG